MGTALPLADPSISGQLPGGRVTGKVKSSEIHIDGNCVHQDLACVSHFVLVVVDLILGPT
jgi:hypothetical protein